MFFSLYDHNKLIVILWNRLNYLELTSCLTTALISFIFITERFHSRENFLHVDIFMRELSYEEITQQVAYDMTNLWSK